MIATWVFVILTALIGIGICVWIGFNSDSIIGIVITAAITVAICGGLLWFLYGTEAGSRAIKDTKSNIDGGIERVITVYDVSGEVVKQYEGKFDVDYDSERIRFDDEKGKRHVIYYKTGTVIVDEK